MLWLLDVTVGLSLMLVLCSFQSTLRIKTKFGVPVAGLGLVSKEEYWPLCITCALTFMQTVKLWLVSPRIPQEQGKPKHYGYGTDLSKFTISWKRQLKVHPGTNLQCLPSGAAWREQAVPLGCPVPRAPGTALAVLGEEEHYTLPQNSNTFVRPVLLRQRHTHYVLSVWLSSGISLMSNGVSGIFWFRVLLWGKAVAFMSVIQAF